MAPSETLPDETGSQTLEIAAEGTKLNVSHSNGYTNFFGSSNTTNQKIHDITYISASTHDSNETQTGRATRIDCRRVNL